MTLYLRVRTGAKTSKTWTGSKMAEVKRHTTGVAIGSWYEDAGTGQTQRQVEIGYDQIPELILFLTEAWVEDQKREARVAKLLTERRAG